MRGKIILEEHVCMPEDDAVPKLKFACLDSEELAAALLDLHGDRLNEMNANGVEYAIISQNPPGPQGIRDAKQAEAYAVRSNDYVSKLADRAPERFAAFGCLSMHDPANAVAELHRCVNDLGMVGVMLHDTQEYMGADGRVCEWHYDDPKYEPFWAAIEKLNVPVYLHPKPPLPEDMARLYAKRPWMIGPTYSFARDGGFHALALCTSGVFDRYPGAKLILGHMGEMLLGHLARTDHWLEKRDRPRNLLPAKRTVREYFETNVHITTAGFFHTPVLLHAMSEIGVDRIMFSVDTPYANITEAARWFDTLPISHRDVDKMGRKNALELFPSLARRMRSEETESLQQNRERELFTRNPGF